MAVLGATLRRAIASRKAVPADVKDQSCVPLHSSFQRERGKYIPFPRPAQAGFGEIEVLRAVGMGMRGTSLMRQTPPLAFAAGRFGVLEIGRKLQKRLRTSKSPHLQAAKAKRCFATASSVLFRQTARRDASPHRTATTSTASPAVGRATMAGGFLSHCEGNYEPVQGDL